MARTGWPSLVQTSDLRLIRWYETEAPPTVEERRARRAERDGNEPEAIPFLKRFTVFNTDQCEDLPTDFTTAPPPVPEGPILPQAESLIAATGADFRTGGDRAFYAPTGDYL